MTFTSLEPFIPSGKNFESAKNLFIDLGFELTWNQGGYAGLRKDECSFILQQYDNKEFAENLMISVRVSDIDAYFEMLMAKGLIEKYQIKISPIISQPYGRELNVIDLAGVCWHFIG